MLESIAGGYVIQPRLKFDRLIDRMLFQHFVTEANFKASDQCEIGELIVTVTSLADETGWSYGVVRGVLKRLEEKEYISIKTRNQKRGLIIKVNHYSEFQTLKMYEKDVTNKGNNKEGGRKNAVTPSIDGDSDSAINKAEKKQKINKENNKQLTSEEQSTSKEVNKENDIKKPIVSSDKVDSISQANKENNKQLTNEKQTDDKEIHNTITAFITSLNDINVSITLKDYLDSANVKSMNLTSHDDIEIFVDFAFKLNTFPEGASQKILQNYFDMVRLTRQTCAISARVLANLIEKLVRYNANQINYALWLHHDQHDDKKENYTLGILRNTTDHEARRGLMKLKNKNGGVNNAVAGSGYDEYEYGF